MTWLRPLMILLTVIGLWIPLTNGTVSASATPIPTHASQPNEQPPTTQADDYGLHCAAGVCTVKLGLPGLSPGAATVANAGAAILLQTLQENVEFVPDNAHMTISDDVQLIMPIGAMDLLAAELVLQRTDDGNIDRMRGTARVPFPALGWLEDVELDAPLAADVGLDWGRNLSHLNAPLDPARRYLFLTFDAGLNLSAPLAQAENMPGNLAISIPQGQRATLIIDPQEPFIYLTGHITLRHTEQVALIGQLLDPEGALPLAPDAFPIQEYITVQVDGLLTDDRDEAFVQLGGGFALHSGAMGRWVGVELTPISLHGLLTLNRQGLLLSGVAESRIQPERFFTGNLVAQIFVPFSDDLGEAYVHLDGGADIPLIGLYAAGRTQVVPTSGTDATASFFTPAFAAGGAVEAQTTDATPTHAQTAAAITESPTDVGVKRAASAPDQTPAWDVRPLVSGVADGAARGAMRSYEATADATMSGYNWLSQKTGDGYEAVADGAACSWQRTERTWCQITGLCAATTACAEKSDTSAVATAE